MIETLTLALNACIPYLVYLAIGYIGREKKLVSEAFFNDLNTFVFKAFFPFLMINSFYHIDTSKSFDHRFWFFCLFAVIGTILVLCAAVPHIVKDHSKISTIIQALFRSNYLLFGVPMAEALFGQEGTELGSVILAIVIPTYNVASVIILEVFRGGKVSAKQLVYNVLTTPLVVGALIGAAFLLTGIPLPECLLLPIGKLAALSTPIAIVTLGGTLHFNAIGKNMRYIVPTLLFKMGILPLLAYSYGAKNFDRMKKIIRYTGTVIIIFGCLCTVFFRIFAPEIVRFFIDEPESVGYGRDFLRIIAFAAPLAAGSYLMNTVFQSAGRKKSSFILSILRKGVLDIPAMFVFRVFYGAEGVCIATPFAEIVSVFIAVILYLNFSLGFLLLSGSPALNTQGHETPR